MKKSIFVCFLLFASQIISQVKFDTLSVRHVGVGITHYEYYEATNPWTIDVLEIDLTSPYNKIESVKADNKILGYQTVSEMASERNGEGHTVVGGINGDFYASGGIPIGKQIVDGEIVKQNSFYSSLGVNVNNKPYIGRGSFISKVYTKTDSFNLDNVNSTRIADNLILYNSFFGASTDANPYGAEVLVNPLTNWNVNDSIFCIVEKVESSIGNMSIEAGKAVLSGHGIASQFLNDNIEVGDTILLDIRFTSGLNKMNQLIGGYPRIIKDGFNYVDTGYRNEGGPPHTYQRHPRTAAGFSSDSTKLYFVTVDGRGYSVGMTLHELANFMLKINVHHAVNFDGGGSTTMLVRDKIVNVPSDGNERSVANSLLVYSTAPKVDTVSQISISPSNLRLFKGKKATFKIEGWDKFFNPLSIDKSQIGYEITEGIGTIDSNGLFIAGDSAAEGLIIFDYMGIKDTCTVVVKSLGEIKIIPEKVLINTVNTYTFSQSSWDFDKVKINFANSEFDWSVKDTNIAVINNMGILTGKTDGTTEVYMKYENLTDTSIVEVKTLSGKNLLNSFDNINDFSLIGDNLDIGNSSILIDDQYASEGNSSLKVKYQYTGNPSKIYQVHLWTNIKIDGVPDSIELDLMTNGQKNQLIYLFEDDDKEPYQINVKKWAEASTYLDNQPGAFEDITAVEPGSVFNYPVTLTGIVIKLNAPRESGIVYRDSLIMDNLRISYPDVISSTPKLESVPNKILLNQNFPNPFNPTTNITFSIPKTNQVKLNVYNVVGEEIVELLNGPKREGKYSLSFDGSNLSSGVYYYKLSVGNYSSVKKMLLLK